MHCQFPKGKREEVERIHRCCKDGAWVLDGNSIEAISFGGALRTRQPTLIPTHGRSPSKRLGREEGLSHLSPGCSRGHAHHEGLLSTPSSAMSCLSPCCWLPPATPEVAPPTPRRLLLPHRQSKDVSVGKATAPSNHSPLFFPPFYYLYHMHTQVRYMNFSKVGVRKKHLFLHVLSGSTLWSSGRFLLL